MSEASYKAAYEFAVSVLAGNRGKVHLDALAAALQGIPGDDFITVGRFWFEKTRLKTWRPKDVAEICGWFRSGYAVRHICRGIERALETGKTVYSPIFVTPHIHQLATSSAERELRVGRGPR